VSEKEVRERTPAEIDAEVEKTRAEHDIPVFQGGARALLASVAAP